MARPRYFLQAGQRIGRGVVIDPEIRVPYLVGKSKTTRAARLRCDCGNEYVARICDLIGKQPTTKSCGCLNREQTAAARALGAASLRGKRGHSFVDRTGHRYGKLVVVKLVKSQQQPRYGKSGTGLRWLCRCDCGNETVVLAGSLRAGNTRSCGCFGWALRLPPGVSARNKLRKIYRERARKKQLPWELDDDFGRLTSLDCFYCGAAPSSLVTCGHSEYTYNGLDRIDNALGYTRENTVPCCWICNNAKKDMPYDDFMAWIARLTEYHFFHPDVMPSALLRKAAG